MMEKIKCVLIGCGKRGHLHLDAIRRDERFSLAAICDTKPEAMAAIAGRFSLDDTVGRYTSYEKMLAEVQPELVIQALWPEHRLPVYRACIAYGVKQLVSEKPFAPNMDDAREIRRLAENSDCRLSYTHQRRFSVGNRRVRELLKQDVIGEIRRIDLFAFRHLLDCGTHSLDQAWSYLGDVPIDWVMGSLDLNGKVNWFNTPGEGSFAGTIHYRNGILGSIILGIDGLRPDSSGVTLYGTKGYMELDWEGKLYGHASVTHPELLDEFAKLTPAEALGANIPDMWHHIADCYLAKTTDELNWFNAYRAAEVIFALYESVRIGGRVNLPCDDIHGNPLEKLV